MVVRVSAALREFAKPSARRREIDRLQRRGPLGPERVFRIDEAYAALADGILALGDTRIAALDERLVARGIAAPFVIGAGASRGYRGGGQGGGQDEPVSHHWISLLRPGSANRARIAIE